MGLTCEYADDFDGYPAYFPGAFIVRGFALLLRRCCIRAETIIEIKPHPWGWKSF